jgi:uncharacterized protein YdeI (YjbR/CyaY-like superfamily)
LTAVTGLTNSNVTLTAPQAAKEIITLSGTLTGNVQIIFPPWEDQWLIANNTSGAFSVTCKTASGSGVVVPQGVTSIVYSDGTNIALVGSSISANSGAVANTLALRDSNAYLWAASFKISTSDRRLKKNVQRIENALGRLALVRGVTFEWKRTPGERSAGLIAQELGHAVPEGVQENHEGFLGLDPMAAIALLIEAVKEESGERKRLEKRLAKLEARG